MKKEYKVYILTILLFTVGNLAFYITTKDVEFNTKASTKESIWDIQKAKIDKLKTPVDVIFLGDSTVREAILETEFTEKTGLRTLNLGLTGDMITYGNFKIYDYYREKFPAPKYVFYWHTLDVWYRGLKPYLFFYMNNNTSDFWDFLKSKVSFRKLRLKQLKYSIDIPRYILKNLSFQYVPLYRNKLFFTGKIKQYTDPSLNINKKSQKVHITKKPLTVHDVNHYKNFKIKPSSDTIFWLNKLKESASDTRLIALGSPLHKVFFTDKELNDQRLKNINIVKNINDDLNIPFVNPGNHLLDDEHTNSDKDHANDIGKLYITNEYANLFNEIIINDK